MDIFQYLIARVHSILILFSTTNSEFIHEWPPCPPKRRYKCDWFVVDVWKYIWKCWISNETSHKSKRIFFSSHRSLWVFWHSHHDRKCERNMQQQRHKMQAQHERIYIFWFVIHMRTTRVANSISFFVWISPNDSMFNCNKHLRWVLAAHWELEQQTSFILLAGSAMAKFEKKTGARNTNHSYVPAAAYHRRHTHTNIIIEYKVLLNAFADAGSKRHMKSRRWTAKDEENTLHSCGRLCWWIEKCEQMKMPDMNRPPLSIAGTRLKNKLNPKPSQSEPNRTREREREVHWRIIIVDISND